MEMFNGINGKIKIFENYLVISRVKQIERLFHIVDEKHIDYSDIAFVKYVPGAITNGYISIIENNSSPPKNLIKAIKDDNTIIFRMFSNKKAKKIVAIILGNIGKKK